jgi:hypothetical protein
MRPGESDDDLILRLAGGGEPRRHGALSRRPLTLQMTRCGS